MRTLVLALLACVGTTANANVLYKHSLDANNQFDRYDIATDTWTPLNGYSSRLNMAFSDGRLYALNADTNMIQIYDPGFDSWTDVTAGPAADLAYGNLERLPDGEFVAHASVGSSDIHYTVGGAWTTTNLGFQPDAMGAYDPDTNRLIVGEYATDQFHVIDVGTWTQVGQIALGGFNGEYARAGTILTGRFYTQYDSTNLLSFDIATISDIVDHGAGTSFQFYDSLAADPRTRTIYVCDLFGSQLQSWDSVGLSVTPLTGGPDNGNHSSIVWFGDLGGECYPDFTGEGDLDLFDFLAFVNEFNDQTDRADCTEEGNYDLFDFLCFVNAFNDGC
jgi:hypothetical protein